MFAMMCAKYADDLRAAEPLLVDPYKKTGNPVIKTLSGTASAFTGRNRGSD